MPQHKTNRQVFSSTYVGGGRWSQPVSTAEFLIDRGYTGHACSERSRREMLDEFGIIDMNGRIYDPIIARFFSPDPFVQAPDFSQNYNRYSYVMNNPLVYTDPSGELVWMIPMAVGFATGYISHGATTGDWGWSAVGSGAIGAAVATIGFYSGGASSAASIASGFSKAGYAATVALGYSGRYVASAAINLILPSMSIPIGDNFSVNVSPGVGFGSSGWTGGVNVSGTYADGKTVISGGVGISGNSMSWGGSATLDGIGASYYQTHYGNAIGPDGNSNNQIVGGIGLHFRDVSVRLENDFFGDRHDRWRSNAFELTIGDFVLGSNLYNNDVGPNAEFDEEGRNYIGNCNRPKRDGTVLGAWKDGQTYSSPLWVGFKANGQVYRFGYSHPLVQDRTQNVVHKWFGPGRTNFFNKYTYFQSGPYVYSGYFNPYSLW